MNKFLSINLFIWFILHIFAPQKSKNMKNFIICLSFTLLTFFSNVNAQSEWSPLDLQVRRIDSSTNGFPSGRSSIAIPSIYINGNVLQFETPCDGCTLQLVNEEGEVEYSVVIPEGTETLTLSSDLSGEYELRIIRGQFCFWGYIDL